MKRGMTVWMRALVVVVGAMALGAQGTAIKVLDRKDLKGKKVDLQATLAIKNGATQVVFTNHGPEPIHFRFYLSGLQQSAAAAKQPRMHVAAGKRAMLSVPGTGAVQSIVVSEVRTGQDSGSFLK